MKTVLPRQEVFALIEGERAYQETRWNEKTTPSEGNHSPQEWLSYIRDYTEEALHIGARESDATSRQKQMNIMRKIATLAVAAMENNGAPART